MRRTLQILLILFGAADIIISLFHIILGPSAIPGSVPVNATMDSEDRFYATLFLAYGITVLWCVKDVEHKSRIVYALMLMFFIGGMARLVSVLAVGLPNTFFIAMTVIELLLPIIVTYIQIRVTAAHMAVQVGAANSRV